MLLLLGLEEFDEEFPENRPPDENGFEFKTVEVTIYKNNKFKLILKKKKVFLYWTKGN